MGDMDASTSQAKARWELENKVEEADDELLCFDEQGQRAIQAEAPWKKNPRHYTKCAGQLQPAGSRLGKGPCLRGFR